MARRACASHPMPLRSPGMPASVSSALQPLGGDTRRAIKAAQPPSLAQLFVLHLRPFTKRPLKPGSLPISWAGVPMGCINRPSSRFPGKTTISDGDLTFPPSISWQVYPAGGVKKYNRLIKQLNMRIWDWHLVCIVPCKRVQPATQPTSEKRILICEQRPLHPDRQPWCFWPRSWAC